MLSVTPELTLLLSTSTCGSCLVSSSAVAVSRTRIMIRLLKLPTTARFGAIADAGFDIGERLVSRDLHARATAFVNQRYKFITHQFAELIAVQVDGRFLPPAVGRP